MNMVIGFVIVSVASIANAAEGDRHPILSGRDSAQVLVEHAEIVPTGNNHFAGYLTIWNGTGSDKFIEGISIEGFVDVDLARRSRSGVTRTTPASAIVHVPAKSELHMDDDTLFVLMDSGAPPTAPKVVVSFDDGTDVTMTGRVLRSGSPRTDHHHPRAFE